ncbi:GDSL esterase/lipase [Hibiscus syriacus]|uniref:GDSL esterase/lipase n=1 Tax=Hibiscus syriacus TaxID=106335 RepID=A0A6A3BCB5_HIBSY|nr:GDSL esterase/lipase [Hibiscus syriacus]
MATSSRWSLKQRLVVSFLVAIITGLNSPVNGCFTSIFCFGDSLTDTGNLLEISFSESGKLPHSAFPPNGRTFFHRPTGRYCDGRLVIDFVAEALGFEFLPPFYGSKNEKFEKGVNFAVSGATALNFTFLAERGIHKRSTNVSLEVELNNFNIYCNLFAHLLQLLRTSLIVVGEIGGNDYNYAFWQGKDTEKIRELVPLVVHDIASAINELIELGAATLLVPGNFPIGCSPSLLTQFQGSDKDNYDSLTGCLTWLNQFAQHHNDLLQKAIQILRTHHPNVGIIYVDYYNTAMRFYRSPEQFGFKETVKACCGVGGPYNYNPSRSCGYPPLKRCCNDPSSYISWDGEISLS